MDSKPHVENLVEFFKVLGEPNRLRIVGLLAQRAYTVEQLSETLGVGASTVSHHLARLARAGLVVSRSESYYNLYSLKTDALSGMAKEMLAQAQPARPASEQDLCDFDRKVLATFTTADGRIRAFPMQERKFRVLLRHVLPSFSHGVRYTEKRVNEILAKYNDDTARLRRWLVDFGYMAREGGGGKYWRVDKDQ
jgi:ArsR family transcriptional regulator, arsenate/arsenite/antimonite-responsive transcriptional repressor